MSKRPRIQTNVLKDALIASEKAFKRSKRKPEPVRLTDEEVAQQNDERVAKRVERMGCGRKGGFRNGPGKTLSTGVEVAYMNNAKFKRPRLANDVEQIHVLQEVYKGAEEKYQAGLKEKLQYSRLAMGEGKGNRSVTKLGKQTAKKDALNFAPEKYRPIHVGYKPKKAPVNQYESESKGLAASLAIADKMFEQRIMANPERYVSVLK